MWQPGSFTWASPHLRFATPTSIVPKPWQQPHPAPWSAAVDEASAAFAGRSGMGLLAFPVLQPMATTAAMIRAYRNAVTSPRPLTSVLLERVAAAVTIICLPDDGVPGEVFPALRRWYRVTAEMALGWGYDSLIPSAFPLLDDGLEAGQHDRELLALDSVVVGSPRQCADRLAAYADLDVDMILCACDPGGLSSEHALPSIERLGREVLPRLRSIKAT
jgi:alkanesulfonate monooxygenase SsuD/methylene tetrahydromethanopterin reductase-like flavin-dependent oxidoreductase (luciferase family)